MAKSNAKQQPLTVIELYFQNALSINRRLDGLEKALQDMAMASMDVAAAGEIVGNCYVDVTEAVTVQHKEEEDKNGEYLVSNDTADALHSSAKLLALQMRELKVGNSLPNYRASMQKEIFERMPPLREAVKKTLAAGKKAMKYLRKYQKKVETVETKMQKYAKANKPIGESKMYGRQTARRDKAHAKLQVKSTYFTKLYDEYMADVEKKVGEMLDHFLNIECCKLRHALDTVRQVASQSAKCFPPAAGVFVNAARHSLLPGGEDNTLSTRSPSMRHIAAGAELCGNGSLARLPGRQEEPFGGALYAPVSPYGNAMREEPTSAVHGTRLGDPGMQPESPLAHLDATAVYSLPPVANDNHAKTVQRPEEMLGEEATFDDSSKNAEATGATPNDKSSPPDMQPESQPPHSGEAPMYPM
ncbi:hypothetical protein DQ04_11221040 [Trypanosoma grayi]|uniref:hypothetical protein n=1 Tax=Trypanosoma grayi TaxID=71804 RepID=UPI0004F44B95|nr:hypothetical protein DQ04_11221040 [Trypanosoma grayi]KEG07022.1 hypothetical protein DQ04_11221040 [Trypanosoma grayi]